jgi:DNA-binding response OmpR family regulator
MRILVVEDEKKVASFVQRGLEAEHYTVDVVHDGATGLARASDGHYDLVILDLMLPGRDGMAVLRELRARRHTVPVLLLTARVTSRVAGSSARSASVSGDAGVAAPRRSSARMRASSSANSNGLVR